MPGTEELRSRVNGIMAGMADVLGSGQSGRGAEGGGRREEEHEEHEEHEERGELALSVTLGHGGRELGKELAGSQVAGR